ncbi:advillin-like isoform X1 [Saccostrea echinata]|uniref:advillin-like isoform X1 n=1 Tax=Saccostrea echinata TaxID=191078 RepID=UPI002A8230FB|nr:advillin-like isoform X1 [Saccostrea echinata]
MKGKTGLRRGSRPHSRGKKPDLERLCEFPSRAPSALPDRLVKSPTFISEKTYKPYNSKRPSTSRTYLSSLSNHADIKLRGSKEKVTPVKSSLVDMEPAFVDVSKDVPGLTVWRLEGKSRLVEIDDRDIGFFHEGAVYISLQINDDGEASLHYWIGAFANEDHKSLIEEKAHELDRIVTHAAVFSRESQCHESPCFMRLFPDGIVYVESKPKTTVSKASIYAKRMYRIFGRKFIRAACTEPSLEALDSEAACILDGFPRMYVWIGRHCNYALRNKAIQTAKRIRNLQRQGIAHIIVVDERDDGMSEAFKKKLHNSVQISQQTQSCSSDSQDQDNTEMRMHRVNGDHVMYNMPEAAKPPFYQRYLVQRDCYLLDRGPGLPLYVWVGSQAHENEILYAIKRGKTFSQHKQYPDVTPVCRISDDAEPNDFKQNFYDWREKDTKHRKLKKLYSIGNIERALFSRRDKRTVAKKNELWSTDTLPDGEEDTEIWKIDGYKMVKMDNDQHGIFNNGHSYVVLHRIRIERRTQQVLYYWLGSKLTNDDQDSVLDLVLSMNKTLNNQCIVIRVLDGREPTHFMYILGNCLIIYDKDLGDTTDVQTSRMFCVREQDPENTSMRVQQVPVSSSSLNSSAAFILHTPSDGCFLWFGQKSGGSEREYAKQITGYISPTSKYEYVVMTEGRESKSFWNLIGRKQAYPLEFKVEVLDRRPPRLLVCNVKGNKTTFEAIEDFKQEDLCENEIFVLDVYDQIYIWNGAEVESALHKQTPNCLKCYIQSDPAGRSDETISVWFLTRNNEPDAFTKFFPYWTENGTSGQQSYELCRKLIRQENFKVDIEKQMVDRTYVGRKKYDYEDLLKKKLPDDVDPQHKEHHLSDYEFKRALKYPRDQFYRLPFWKQEQLFKSARLGHTWTSENPYKLRIESPDLHNE